MDTNYIGGIIRILELPKQQIRNNNILVTKVRAQIYKYPNSHVVILTFWGNLASNITTSFKIDDYFIIEGFISIRDNSIFYYEPKKIEITILKIYPIVQYNFFMN